MQTAKNLRQLNEYAIDYISEIFPQMEWQRGKGNYEWISGYKWDGTRAKDARSEKCVIYSKGDKTHIYEHGEDDKKGIDILDMMVLQNIVSDKSSGKKWLIDFLSKKGIEYKEEEESSAKGKADIEWQIEQNCKRLFSEEGKDALQYLRSEEGDCFRDEEIKKMRLGYYAMKSDKTKKLVGRIWFPLMLGGKPITAQGRRFRKEDDKEAKYHITGGFQKGDYVWGMPKGKVEDVVIVEGIKCSLRAAINGLNNIVAVGGHEISDAQILHLERRGVNKITLMFDGDKAGKDGTKRAIEKILKNLPSVRLYVCPMPNEGEGTDISKLIGKHNAEYIRQILECGTQSWYIYNLYKAYEEYGASGKNTADVDRYKEQVYQIALSLSEKMDREELFAKAAELSDEVYITAEGLEEYVRNRAERERVARVNGEIKSIVRDITTAESSRNYDGIEDRAADLLSALRSRKQHKAESLLLTPYTLRDYAGEVFEVLPDVKFEEYEFFDFGKNDGRKALSIPSGGISFICGAPSDGKSTFLRNLALNLARQTYSEMYDSEGNRTDEEEQVVLYYSYEEARYQVLEEFMLTNYNKDIDSSTEQDKINAKVRNVLRGEVRDDDFFKSCLEFSKRYLETNILHIVETDDYVEDIADDIMNVAAKVKVKAVFVDYVQLVGSRRSKERKNESESLRLNLKEVGLVLHRLAKKLGVPVIAAAQLNRESYGSPAQWSLANLAEAADLERIGTLIMFITKGGKRIKDDKDKFSHIWKGRFDITDESCLYARIMKDRFGKRDMEGGFNWNLKTGYIGRQKQKL